MHPDDCNLVAGPVPATRDATGDYARILRTLAMRARRLGSRDHEGAAQEALKRSLENENSRRAMEFYFSDSPLVDAPQWTLDHLYAWLHAVLQNVIREERSRAGFHREVESNGRDRADSGASPLEVLMRNELDEILDACFQRLDGSHRRVLQLRAEGLKYGEIADRLGVSENTVATWVSRGTAVLGQMIRKRWGSMGPR